MGTTIELEGLGRVAGSPRKPWSELPSSIGKEETVERTQSNVTVNRDIDMVCFVLIPESISIGFILLCLAKKELKTIVVNPDLFIFKCYSFVCYFGTANNLINTNRQLLYFKPNQKLSTTIYYRISLTFRLHLKLKNQ